MKNKQTHYRGGAVVLYKRERSNKWQARLKIGKGDGAFIKSSNISRGTSL